MNSPSHGTARALGLCTQLWLRLSEKEQRALKKRAERDGVSMQDAARRAIREYLDNSEHTTRVIDAAKQIMKVHAEAIEQLGD
ncbi:MAG: ribbon-helix-helix protein, CopG family [Actinobacteria bacterium]|nr:ribbon-helix-helix protein, CopG family [Actinomycetota bacterium]